MSRMLSLFECGFDAAAGLARAGRPGRARTTLDGLLALPSLTAEQSVRGHRAAATLALAAGRHRRARTHLRAAIALAPQDADLFHALGRAFEEDPYGCDRRARWAYRKASQLNANEPKYKAALGRAMVRIHEVRSGVRVMCRAAKAAPTDVGVLEIVAEGLREARQPELAFRLLTQARFLAPADTGIQSLWSRAKYDLALQGQRNEPATPKPEVLPFLRLHEPGERAKPKVRRDTGSQNEPHVGRLRTFRFDRG